MTYTNPSGCFAIPAGVVITSNFTDQTIRMYDNSGCVEPEFRRLVPGEEYLSISDHQMSVLVL
ncbi:hypothetical protein [Streptomyces hoynatensis]|uniref:Uncharacterized protein n=1 Tax=Streptomyces hoynatensis TaxID=1141874 RepID=A0A3A9Z8M9_9ACTN|nr:hypothetical protein [Streptomyces hoynatensis]RKN44751.1 hypothetical protein D7294_06360 [Streptomyces hoynatensis]